MRLVREHLRQGLPGDDGGDLVTSYTFDSFECAIHKLAPECDHCGCRIVGHGTEANGEFFCCAHCSKKEDVTGVVDRVT